MVANPLPFGLRSNNFFGQRQIFLHILGEIQYLSLKNFQNLISLLFNRRKASKGEHCSTRKQMGTSVK
jgi:hypothetical protein